MDKGTALWKQTTVIFVLLYLCFSYNDGVAQAAATQDAVGMEQKMKVEEPDEDDKPQEAPEVMPEFPGGMEALMGWLGRHMVYPEDCRRDSIEGRVLVSFVVEADGAVSNVQALKSPHPALAEAGERVVEQLPRWKPGRKNGKAVRVKLTLPILYRLEAATANQPATKPKDDIGFSDPCEVMPEFPGGREALVAWMGKHLRYPKDKTARSLDGKVYVSFAVNADGTITDVKAVRSPHPAFSEEAEKVVRKMPRWKPGTLNDRPVRMKYVLPIVFQRPKD